MVRGFGKVFKLFLITKTMKKGEKINVNKYCRETGIVLIILGVIHIIFSGFLSEVWGFLLIIVGIISLVSRTHKMIMVVGIILVLVGFLNISSSLFIKLNFFWLLLGGVQIYLGIKELIRYKNINEMIKHKRAGKVGKGKKK